MAEIEESPSDLSFRSPDRELGLDSERKRKYRRWTRIDRQCIVLRNHPRDAGVKNNLLQQSGIVIYVSGTTCEREFIITYNGFEVLMMNNESTIKLRSFLSCITFVYFHFSQNLEMESL